MGPGFGPDVPARAAVEARLAHQAFHAPPSHVVALPGGTETRPRNTPSRASFRHRDNMKWVSLEGVR
jgi:hypothetical protein